MITTRSLKRTTKKPYHTKSHRNYVISVSWCESIAYIEHFSNVKRKRVIVINNNNQFIGNITNFIAIENFSRRCKWKCCVNSVLWMRRWLFALTNQTTSTTAVYSYKHTHTQTHRDKYVNMNKTNWVLIMFAMNNNSCVFVVVVIRFMLNVLRG